MWCFSSYDSAIGCWIWIWTIPTYSLTTYNGQKPECKTLQVLHKILLHIAEISSFFLPACRRAADKIGQVHAINASPSFDMDATHAHLRLCGITIVKKSQDQHQHGRLRAYFLTHSWVFLSYGLCRYGSYVSEFVRRWPMTYSSHFLPFLHLWQDRNRSHEYHVYQRKISLCGGQQIWLSTLWAWCWCRQFPIADLITWFDQIKYCRHSQYLVTMICARVHHE